MSPEFLIDFYKVGHIDQYPEGISRVWVNWTPRHSRVPSVKKVVFFGLQYLMEKYFIETFDKEFFSIPEKYVISEYKDVIGQTLGITNPRTDHIRDLHRVGYLPIEIYAIPEGYSTPLGVPPMVMTNTISKFFWLPNYLETLTSNILWKPSTSATTAKRYRNIFTHWARKSGEADLGFVDWMGHDFSYRGMGGLEDALLSGMGHLTSFSGTDTLPAILAARRYYGASLNCGGSVWATEHSVMSAGEKDRELETFRRLIEDVYPSGIVSIVSDTWDLWKVLTEYVPALRDKIRMRNGKVVVRPDSGDPPNILCGDPTVGFSAHSYNTQYHPASIGVLQLLADALGVNRDRIGLPLINGAGAIYGDSITPERAETIMQRTVEELGLSPYNVVLGIGSYTYVYVTRDTFGYAMKATAIEKNGVVIPIFKNPITDSGIKKSCKGIPVVRGTYEDYRLEETNDPSQLDRCAYSKVFQDSTILVPQMFEKIRERVRCDI
jgi:nicotinamide phosphoribosyltransferase